MDVTHPALGVIPHDLPLDIYSPVFDWVFEHPVFDRWVKREGVWQLHCVGGPGAGKTTLAALVSHKLRETFQDDDIPVAAILIKEDVIDYEHVFLEDFLRHIYQVLGESEALIDDDSGDVYEDYETACVEPEGTRASFRIRLIQEAVRLRVSSCPRAFLVLDGLDRCNSALHILLERELSDLQEKGLTVMITSRIPVFEQVEARCDHPMHSNPNLAHDEDPTEAEEDEEFEEEEEEEEDDDDDDNGDEEEDEETGREVLDIFMLCKVCGNVMCFPCKNAGRECQTCQNNDGLYEHYDHVNITIGQIPESFLRDYIAWELEREHGDLGLASSLTRKPPLSDLGLSLIQDPNASSPEQLVQEIVNLAQGNIGLAKTRLDNIHEVDYRVGARTDRLPANMVAIFDAGMKQVEVQQEAQRDLGLKAIASSGKSWEGIAIPHLQQSLSKSKSIFGRPAPMRSGEDILQAAKGYLLATTRENPAAIRLFHLSFFYYVAQNYNESLYWANLHLKQDNILRSYTIMSSLEKDKERSLSQDETEEAPTFADKFVRFDPISMPDNPPKRTTFKLSRTKTSFIPGKSQMASLRHVSRKGTAPD